MRPAMADARIPVTLCVPKTPALPADIPPAQGAALQALARRTMALRPLRRLVATRDTALAGQVSTELAFQDSGTRLCIVADHAAVMM